MATAHTGNQDDSRLALGELVKKGAISADEAAVYAQKLGLMTTGGGANQPVISRGTSFSKIKQTYNFSVYKWSKGRTVQRLILQFDFQSQSLSSIQHGTRTKKLEFSDIKDFQSEDGLRLSIQFHSQSEYELDADTQDEKNKMIRLLDAIVRRQPQIARAGMEESQQILQDQLQQVHAVMTEEEREEEEEGAVGEEEEERERSGPGWGEPQKTLAGPAGDDWPVPAPPRITAAAPIKEGVVEKRGHSVAFLMWPKRWLKVCDGELLYFRTDDTENALNIIPLTPSVTEVKKVDSTVFTVTLTGSRRLFSFRPVVEPGQSLEAERNSWYKAIMDGCYKRRLSDARLRKGTLTAKQAYTEYQKKRLKKSTLEREREGQSDHQGEPPDPFEEPTDDSPKFKRRSMTLNNFKLRLRKSFHAPGPRGVSSQQPTSPTCRSPGSGFVSYGDQGFDVTTPYTKPMELRNLVIAGKDAAELLLCLKKELDILGNIILHTSTGSSQVDMIVARMSSLISAIREQHSQLGLEAQEASESSNDPSSIFDLSGEGRSPQPSDAEGQSLQPSSTGQRSSTEPPEDVPESVSPEAVLSPAHSDPGPISPHRQAGSPASGPLPPDQEPELSPAPPSEAPSSAAEDSGPSHTASPRALSPPTPTSPAATLASPPPPPPIGGGPVPPPPPPFPGGVPPPPPPMFGGGPPAPPFGMPSLPPRPVHTPGKKMKRIYWTPIQATLVPTSGWMDWSKKDLTEQLDLQQLEQLFGADDKDGRNPLPVRRPQVTSLLDTSRARNIEIFLPRLPFALVDLDCSLNDHLNNIGDSCPLDLEHLVALKRFQPTQEDREMYKRYKGDKHNLPNADIFLVKLCEIPMLTPRLDLLFTIREFPSNFEGFQPIITLAWQATRELDACRGFEKLLQYVLAVGNYLNAGSRQGGAYGFRISTLAKISEMRAGGGRKTTLLHYLVEQLHRCQPDLLELPAKMEAVGKASEISIMSIVAELEVMHKELDRIERNTTKVAEHPKMTQSALTDLQKEVKVFVERYRSELKALDEKGQEAEDTYRQLLLTFGEPLSTDSEDFFSAIANFLKQLKRVCLELYPPPPPTAKPKSNPPKQDPSQIKTSEGSRPSSRASDVPIVVVKDSGGVERQPQAGVQASPRKVDPPPHRTPGPPGRRVEPREGYLEKRTRDGRKWNRRYFELERGQLHYYQDQGRKYGDTIRLYRGIPLVTDETDARVFTIGTEGRTWVFRAETLQLALEWVTSLRAHCQAA